MRVIAGTARGARLQAVPGSTTRPISDRVKEALFGILGQSIVGARFLDLFAGTGGVGIEALSRGASRVVFVDSEPRAVATIRANLSKTHLQPGAHVVNADAFRYLAREPDQFDLIYLAPPQYAGLWRRALLAVDASPRWLAAGAQVIVQIFPKEFETLTLDSLLLSDQRRYGSTLLCFYEGAS